MQFARNLLILYNLKVVRWLPLLFFEATFCPAAELSDTYFVQKVAPILAANCSACHSDKLKTSGFVITTPASVIGGGSKYGTAVISGDPAGSPLVKILKGQITPRMPMGKALAEGEIAIIEQWVRELKPEQISAAKANDWLWPYKKPVKHEPPQVARPEWVSNPIDAFVLNRLEGKKLAPAPSASKRVLARRVYFDLIGMPPTPDELNTFLADKSPDAYASLVDKLLADPRYGEHWGRHWLDLARYGETSGLEGDGAIGNAWRYRDWVIDSFNSDMSYDRFVVKQLAGGDEHSQTRNNYAPDVQGMVPVAFLRLAPWDRSNLVADEVRQNYLNEVTTATGSVFLGLTIGCARCHDHKYDPIPTKDFYRMQAFFNAVKVEDVEVPYKDRAFADYAQAKIEEYEAQLKSGPEKKELDELEKSYLEELIRKKTEAAKSRPLQVEDLRLELRRKNQKLFSPEEIARHQELLEDAERTLDLEFRKTLDESEKELLKKLNAAVANGATDNLARYRELTVKDVQAEVGKSKGVFSELQKEKHRELSAKLAVIQRRIARLQPRTLSITNVPGPPNGPGVPLTHILKSGDYRQPGEAVEPGFPSAITGNFEPAALETDRYRQFPTRGRRMTLAKWIANPDNPLTARVMVNRIWQQHFGRGIVETTSDFGKNGSRPTHPELLDWLAIRFIEEKWSVKQMHRLMLNSNTYKQAAENPADKDNTIDPDNKLLWKFNRRRLEAEEIRDGILFASGRLNLARGGPSVFPPLPADLADFARYGRTGGDMWEPNEKEADDRRRSIYTFQRRSLPQPMMLAFDAPVFSESCERRSVTTTALQALAMMNGDLVNDEAGHLAERVIQTAGADRRAQISRVFEILLSRPPKSDELNRFAAYSGSLASVCRVLMDSNEFLYVD
jgi:mono/diheme cytochrome c family protein